LSTDMLTNIFINLFYLIYISNNVVFFISLCRSKKLQGILNVWKATSRNHDIINRREH